LEQIVRERRRMGQGGSWAIDQITDGKIGSNRTTSRNTYRRGAGVA
jgi:hypothetical protein